MKKLIGMVIASLLFSNIGFAEMKAIEENVIQVGESFHRVATICVDGYKFVITRPGDVGVSMVQFMRKNKAHGTAYPETC